jgi:hypothetical protein
MSVTINGDTGISGVNGSAATPAIQGGDADTGIFFGSDTASISTGGTSRISVDSSGRLLVGTTTEGNADADDLTLQAASGYTGITLRSGSTTGGAIYFSDATSGAGEFDGYITYAQSNQSMSFGTAGNGSPRMLIDSSGNVRIGQTTGASAKLSVYGSQCRFQGAGTGAGESDGFGIGNNGATDSFIWNYENGFIQFGTNNTQQMLLNSGGDLHINKNEFTSHNTMGHTLHASGWTHHSSMAGVTTLFLNRSTSVASAEGNIVEFYLAGSYEGNIYINSSGIFFNSVSDYRLKENVINIADGITRLKQLSPRRFNFIKNTDVTVDGFIAHEVQTVVPEAVCGEKDGEEMQGMDHARLVPLLTAALQEAIAKIETLEERLNDAGIS